MTHFFREMKQIHLLAQLPVITCFGLLQQFQVSIQLLLLWKRDAVYAGQLFVLFVAFPVGTSNAHDLRGLYKSRVRHVRPPAQIRKVPLIVKGDCTIL